MSFGAPIDKAVRWDLHVQQGSTFERTLEFVGAEFYDIQFRGQIRRSHADTTVLATFACQPAGFNRLRIALTAQQTEALPRGTWVYDIEAYVEYEDTAYYDYELDETVVFPASAPFVARVLEGRVRVTPEVTR
jgi:hypothetical protein